MSDTIYSYYSVNLTKDLAIDLGYLADSYAGKFDYNCTIKGRVCIQIDRPPKGLVADSYIYKVSYSFCSPKDNFSKATARNICRSRIQSTCFLTINSDRPLKARELSERAINFIHEAAGGRQKFAIESVKVPNWFSLSKRDMIRPDFRGRSS